MKRIPKEQIRVDVRYDGKDWVARWKQDGRCFAKTIRKSRSLPITFRPSRNVALLTEWEYEQATGLLELPYIVMHGRKS